LKLFDYGVSDQHFDAWHERAILKCWHCDAMDVPQIIRFYRSDLIAEAPGNSEAKDCRK
jgi:hypothetical protein